MIIWIRASCLRGTVVPEDRSLMNVPFVTGSEELDAKFVKEAKAAGFENLKRPQNRRRHESKYLQCYASGGRGSFGSVYEEI